MTADPNEMASEQEEATRQSNLEKFKARQEKAPLEWDGQSCVEEICGLPIDSGRLDLGLFRCFDCQKAKEDLIKRMRK